jgi:excisionase family DNA binding protein
VAVTRLSPSNRPNKRLYTVKEAAKYLGQTVWGMRTLIWNGHVPVVQTGQKQFIDVVDMDKFIERNKMTWN